jgi:hypothetical protein
MTSTNPTTRILAKDIHARWPKFTDSEAAAVKNHADLTAQVVKSYNMDKAQADKDVTSWVAGRSF